MGELSPPMIEPASGRPVTLKDIAKAVRLSHGAVSLALRNSPRIAPATRARVQAKAREMGYQPNPMGAGLAQFKRTFAVKPVHAALAWLNCWPESKALRSYAEFDLYWQGAAACAEKFGYRLNEFHCGESMTGTRLEAILHSRGINGVILPPTGANRIDLGAFPWEHFSVVRLGRRSEAPHIHCVSSDQSANEILAYRNAREKGYQRIAFVGAPWKAYSCGAGLLWAQMTDSSAKSRVLPFFVEERMGEQEPFVRWLRKTKPDAILTDRPELPARLSQAGYRVPEDIGLAATTVLDCPIDAGIYQNPEEIGRVGVLVLISLINDNDRGVPAIPREILIKGKWVDGASLPKR